MGGRTSKHEFFWRGWGHRKPTTFVFSGLLSNSRPWEGLRTGCVLYSQVLEYRTVSDFRNSQILKYFHGLFWLSIFENPAIWTISKSNFVVVVYHKACAQELPNRVHFRSELESAQPIAANLANVTLAGGQGQLRGDFNHVDGRAFIQRRRAYYFIDLPFL